MSNLLGVMCVLGLAVMAGNCLAAAPATTQAGSPKAAVMAMIEAAEKGRAATVRHLLHAANADEAMTVDAVTELVIMRARYERAMRDQFGKEAAGTYGVPWLVSREALQNATEVIDGNRAEVVIQNQTGSRRLPLAYDADTWKVSLPAAASPEGVFPADEPVRRYADMTEALVQATQSVMTGQYKTAQQASQETATLVERAYLGRDAN